MLMAKPNVGWTLRCKKNVKKLSFPPCNFFTGSSRIVNRYGGRTVFRKSSTLAAEASHVTGFHVGSFTSP